MRNTINVAFNPKTNRLVLDAPFHLNDVIREFPSRRFNPKGKKWDVPLVAGNLKHLESVRHKYDFSMSQEALDALTNVEKLTAGPKYLPFPGSHDFLGKTPFEHQGRMLDHTWNLPASAWFAKMGTGKTFATIHLAMARFKAGMIDRLCIICPSTLRNTWRKELKKYAREGSYDFRIHDPKDKGYQKWALEVAGEKGVLKILAVSVEGLGVSEGLYDSACLFIRGKCMTACDESSRIKNPKALRTNRAIAMGGASTFRLILNGTPIALGLHDLFTQYEFLDPNIIGLGDYWAFKTRYLEMGGYESKQIVGYQNTDELMGLIGPFTMQVGKEVLDLPPKVPITWDMEATPYQRKLFKWIVKGESDIPMPQIKVTNTLERMLRLRQVVGGWLPKARVEIVEVPDPENPGEKLPQEVWHTDLEPLPENPKMDLLFERIEDNRIGSKFIIWSTFVHEIEYIRDRLAKIHGPETVRAYYGKTAMEDRSAIEDAYCNNPEVRFFVGNPAAAGLGLTLISGENDVMVYYSGTNAFIDRSQSEDRAHRIGQKNSVLVADCVMVRSVDEVIQQSIRMKMDIDEYISMMLKDNASRIKLSNVLSGEDTYET